MGCRLGNGWGRRLVAPDLCNAKSPLYLYSSLYSSSHCDIMLDLKVNASFYNAVKHTVSDSFFFALFLQIVQHPTQQKKVQLTIHSKKVAERVTDLVKFAEELKGNLHTHKDREG